jgi:DNA polymerase epsilon subunit 2
VVYFVSDYKLCTGPLDAGTSVALPRRPIPEQYTKSLRQRVRHITFASNPCRVRYFTQEIVLFREDLLKKMQRHLAVPLVLDDPTVPDITEQLVESLLDQVGMLFISPHGFKYLLR